MRLRSFHGINLTEAMKLVRDTLGDDAIIVATRDDENGGVRVTAAIDDVVQADIKPPCENTDKPADNISTRTGSEVIETIAKALLKHQVPTSIAEKLLASSTQFANDDPVVSLAAALETHIQFNPLPTSSTEKPIIFVGVPGSGKTLCTAKMTAGATLAGKPAIVISTDTERAGGVEQLAAFTRLMKIDLMEIEDHHALKDALSIQPAGSIIVIDTPGRNPFDPEEKRQLQQLISAGGNDAVLVIPADMDAFAAIDIAQEIKSIGATRLLFTRLDLTRRLGSILRTAFETKLPLSNYSNTYKVTETLVPFNSVVLAKLILERSDNTSLSQLKATGTGHR